MDREEINHRLEAKLLVYADQITEFRRQHGIPSGGFCVKNTTQGSADYQTWLEAKQGNKSNINQPFDRYGGIIAEMAIPLDKLLVALRLKPKWGTWLYSYVVLGETASPGSPNLGYLPELEDEMMLLIDRDTTKAELTQQLRVIRADKGTTVADKRMQSTPYLPKYIEVWNLKKKGAKTQEIGDKLFGGDYTQVAEAVRRIKTSADDLI